MIRKHIIEKLRDPNNEIALQGLELARKQGWLKPSSKKLVGLDLSGTNLSGGDFNQAQMYKVHFMRAKLRDASFIECVLALADFESADMHKAKLKQAHCSYTRFFSASLVEAECVYGMFTGANFNEAKLTGTDFSGANLNMATLVGTDLTNAILNDVSLSWAMIVTDLVSIQQLVRTRTLIGATLPNGVRYDGRYRLNDDIEIAKSAEIDIANPAAMADFYQVSIEAYFTGQKWADENLSQYWQ